MGAKAPYSREQYFQDEGNRLAREKYRAENPGIIGWFRSLYVTGEPFNPGEGRVPPTPPPPPKH